MGCMGVSSYLVGGLQGHINFPYESFHLLDTLHNCFSHASKGMQMEIRSVLVGREIGEEVKACVQK